LKNIFLDQWRGGGENGDGSAMARCRRRNVADAVSMSE